MQFIIVRIAYYLIYSIWYISVEVVSFGLTLICVVGQQVYRTLTHFNWLTYSNSQHSSHISGSASIYTKGDYLWLRILNYILIWNQMILLFVTLLNIWVYIYIYFIIMSIYIFYNYEYMYTTYTYLDDRWFRVKTNTIFLLNSNKFEPWPSYSIFTILYRWRWPCMNKFV